VSLLRFKQKDAKRSEMKRNEAKRSKTKRNEAKRSKTKRKRCDIKLKKLARLSETKQNKVRMTQFCLHEPLKTILNQKETCEK
jgi:hypothetical protein